MTNNAGIAQPGGFLAADSEEVARRIFDSNFFGVMRKELPVKDVVVPSERVREDGRMVHDMLLLQVRKPSESREPGDYYHMRAVIPGEQAFKALAQSTCPRVKK